jgi:hypothetical protein
MTGGAGQVRSFGQVRHRVVLKRAVAFLAPSGTFTVLDSSMKSTSKIRIVGVLVAIAVPCAMLALAGPVIDAMAHAFQQWFDSLTPVGHARAVFLFRSLSYGMPAMTGALAAVLGSRRRRVEQAEGEPLQGKCNRFHGPWRQQRGEGRRPDNGCRS